MSVLALLVIPAILVGDFAEDPALREAALATNWVIWALFSVEYLGKLLCAPDRAAFVRGHWFDLALIVLTPPIAVPETMQGTRTLRALRLLRIVRAGVIATLVFRRVRQALYRREAHHVTFVAGCLISIGAMLAFAFERDANADMSTLGDAFWWAIVTTTTVGYGDVSPVTFEGRVIAAVLMVVGIGLMGALSGMFVSTLVQRDHQTDLSGIEARLDRIETLLADLAAPPGRTRRDPDDEARRAA